MKKLAIIVLMILCVTCVFTACNFTQTTYKIQSEKSSYTVTIGEQVDLTSYFTITSSTGENIPVTSDMIDASNADFTKVGVFIVVCSYQGVSKSIIIRVVEPHTHVFDDATCTAPKTCSCGATEGDALGHTVPNEEGKCELCGTQLEDVEQDYTPVTTTISISGLTGTLSNNKQTISWTKNGITVTNDQHNSTTAIRTSDSDHYRIYTDSKLTISTSGQAIQQIVISCLGGYVKGFASSLKTSGATLSTSGTTVTITVTAQNVTSIELVPSAQVRISSIKVTSVGAGGTVTPPSGDDVMPEQSYNKNNHVDYDDILYDAVTNYESNEGALPSTGLLPQGTYNVLVIPVEFSNDKFTSQELTDLGNVFNNKSATGWESVSSYYQTSSYGKLNMTFDIVEKVTLNYSSSYFDGGEDAGEDILKLALDKLDARGFNFGNYDYDNNDVVDGVYIIYSAPIDYDGDYYWAYVNWAQQELVYDNLDVYTYLFASVDFMYEDIETSGSDYAIDGLVLNASTYIHETGHMLGLDDYYDYNPETGSNKGLGCADMMDYTVGDHNAYSKLMLGWVKPTVVTQTQTVTINAFESSGDFIIVLLDYDGTYFSEYLIIDLYSATGLNELHAGVEDSLLYEGAEFGARIYHVDATIANPYSDEYYSFTDNNNSMTSDALIQLIEADGDKNFDSDKEYDNGQYYYYASFDDLWQTGDTFCDIQPNYTRHDGKLVNFDITFDSVTAESATITITFDTNN